MKENAPKKTWFQTLRTLWVPLAIGVVTVAALAVVVGMVWKDYRTAMMDSQTRQMELVVQSTADSIRVLLEEYADRLDSIAGKAEGSKAFRPTVARIPSGTSGWKTAAARSSTAAMASAPSAMSSSPGRRTSPTGSTTAVTSTIL
jgi:hypothetical protein